MHDSHKHQCNSIKHNADVICHDNCHCQGNTTSRLDQIPTTTTMIWKSTPKQTDNFHLNFYDPFKIKRRKRTTQEQTNALEQVFQIYSKPTAKIRFLLSERLSMSPRSIQIWFQNRRAKEKKQYRSKKGTKTVTNVKYHSSSPQHQQCFSHYTVDDVRANRTSQFCDAMICSRSKDGYECSDNSYCSPRPILCSAGMVHSRSQSSSMSSSCSSFCSSCSSPNTSYWHSLYQHKLLKRGSTTSIRSVDISYLNEFNEQFMTEQQLHYGHPLPIMEDRERSWPLRQQQQLDSYDTARHTTMPFAQQQMTMSNVYTSANFLSTDCGTTINTPFPIKKDHLTTGGIDVSLMCSSNNSDNGEICFVKDDDFFIQRTEAFVLQSAQLSRPIIESDAYCYCYY